MKVITVISAALLAVAISNSTSASATAPWGSIYFDGSQYLSSTNMSAPRTGAFTYEFWFNNTATSASNQTLMNSRQSVGVGQQKDGFDVAITSSRSMYASYKSLAFFNTGDNTIELNRWYHFALVRQGNTVYSYLNGNFISSQALAGDGLDLYSQRLWIATTANLSNKFTGYISNYRYTKNNLYSSNFALPSDDFEDVASTSILLKTKNDSSFITNSIAGTTFTNNGGASASSRNPFESNSTQADRDAAAKAERDRIEAERRAAIVAAREKIKSALDANVALTAEDLAKADAPIKSVDSLLLAYKELLLIKAKLTKPLSSEELSALKFNKIMKYAMYERMTGISAGGVIGRDLVTYGVISTDTPMKQLTTYQLMKQSPADRNSIEKVDKFFKAASERHIARKARLAAVIAREQSR